MAVHSSRIVNLVVAVIMVLGGISQFFPLRLYVPCCFRPRPAAFKDEGGGFLPVALPDRWIHTSWVSPDCDNTRRRITELIGTCAIANLSSLDAMSSSLDSVSRPVSEAFPIIFCPLLANEICSLYSYWSSRYVKIYSPPLLPFAQPNPNKGRQSSKSLRRCLATPPSSSPSSDAVSVRNPPYPFRDHIPPSLPCWELA